MVRNARFRSHCLSLPFLLAYHIPVAENKFSNVLIAAQLFDISVNSIEFFTFTPDPASFIVKIRKDDDSFELYFSGLPPSLESHIATLSPSDKQQITSIAVGAKDSWIVVYASGGAYYCNLPEMLKKRVDKVSF